MKALLEISILMLIMVLLPLTRPQAQTGEGEESLTLEVATLYGYAPKLESDDPKYIEEAKRVREHNGDNVSSINVIRGDEILIFQLTYRTESGVEKRVYKTSRDQGAHWETFSEDPISRKEIEGEDLYTGDAKVDTALVIVDLFTGFVRFQTDYIDNRVQKGEYRVQDDELLEIAPMLKLYDAHVREHGDSEPQIIAFLIRALARYELDPSLYPSFPTSRNYYRRVLEKLKQHEGDRTALTEEVEQGDLNSMIRYMNRNYEKWKSAREVIKFLPLEDLHKTENMGALIYNFDLISERVTNLESPSETSRPDSR